MAADNLIPKSPAPTLSSRCSFFFCVMPLFFLIKILRLLEIVYFPFGRSCFFQIQKISVLIFLSFSHALRPYLFFCFFFTPLSFAACGLIIRRNFVCLFVLDEPTLHSNDVMIF